MATTVFVNRARMLTSTTGTGSSVTLTTAVDGYFTLSEAGLQNGDVVDYIIEQGADFEIQHDQTYSDDGMGTVTLSRDTPAASKVGGSAGTSQVELNGTAQVAIVAVAKSLDVSTFTEKSSPALEDLLWGYDSSASARRYFSLTNLFKASTVNLQVFTSNGTYTPTAGMRFALVIATGAGGGGGGADTDGSGIAAGGGGGAGGTAISLLTAAEIGASQAVTVGEGGNGGSDTGGDGGTGGSTTFGSILSASGGDGGVGASATDQLTVLGGDGGSATGGQINLVGGAGFRGLGFFSQRAHITSGNGGPSFWGGGANGVIRTSVGSSPGNAGSTYGVGGSGAVAWDTTSGAQGAAGADGVVMVLEFC